MQVCIRTERETQDGMRVHSAEGNRLLTLTQFGDTNGDHVRNTGEAIIAEFDYTVRSDGQRIAGTEKGTGVISK